MQPKIVTIPMFPLNTVILPGETKLLHIFEDLYKELEIDCMKNGAKFGIPYIKTNKISEYGVEVKITKIAKTYYNDEMDIIVQGVVAFRILKYSKVLKTKIDGAANFEEYEGDMTSARYKMFRS